MNDFNFDKPVNIAGNNFVRTNNEALQSLFGTTDVAPFWIADMEFEIDENITNEMKRIAERGVFSYEKPLDDLYPIMCNWFAKRHNLKLIPENFQIVTGVLTGLSVIIQEFSKKGEGVLIQTPVYHVFKKMIENNHRKAVANSLVLEDGVYKMDLLDMEEKLKTGAVKIVIICNPHNPMGRVWSREELTKVVTLAKKYNVFLLSDEVHSDVVFASHQFTSILDFGDKNSVALLGSPAKTFGMQDTSCGFIYSANSEINKKIWKKIEAMFLFHLSTITVHATRMAYLKAAPWLDAMVNYVSEIVTLLNDFVEKQLPGVKVIQPQGTYQVWLDFRDLKLSSQDLDHLIINKAGIGLTPGYWFGQEGSGFMRMNIGVPKREVLSALEKIKGVL